MATQFSGPAPNRAGLCSRKAAAALRQLRPICRTSKPEVAQLDAPGPVAVASTSGRANRATFKASKLGRLPLVEAQRPLADYMALPASQYSVLDARRIERVDDSTFRCYVGELRFFSWSVEPVITVSVGVDPGGCTIRLLGCKLQGSSFVEDINDRFSATMTNVVRYGDAAPAVPDDDGSEGEGGAAGVASKEIVSDTVIQVCLEVPAWCGFLSVESIERVGSGVMQGVLNAMVPRFLAQLRTDYQLWAAGDESRKPVGEL